MGGVRDGGGGELELEAYDTTDIETNNKSGKGTHIHRVASTTTTSAFSNALHPLFSLSCYVKGCRSIIILSTKR